MDKLKAMQVFVHIADCGSLTAAAEALDSSLPAVVRTLAALEKELAVRLLNRTTRRISLTEEGKHYLQSCRQLLAAIHDAEASLISDSQEPSGLLTITAPVLFGQIHVAPAVTRFVQRYEKMRCNLVLVDRVVNLLEEGIDVGIRIGTLDDSGLIAQPLGNTRRMVVASPSYLSQNPAPDHPKDLQHANCICFNASSGPWWSFQEQGKPVNIAVNGNLEFNQVAPAIDACLAGVGFGVFVSYQIAEHLKQGRLIPVLAAYELPPRPIHVIYPHAGLLPGRTKAFIEWIKAELKVSLASIDYINVGSDDITKI